ncbi:30S ribosome-binding factor RbfA [Geosporobacter ferrireducens]|uniref:Ribosome-binding factor A n=1 Tax=Geosporobacter ferrireducens TaxID=1424294 RepID=A0A1D8GBF0_9FIRM|nr:30S ribosome-binding factor RbfA [Geosporobacter ferrireducens]AOT68234.1 ribosome-binding factor A [Geosporobacter ferrireducens]
MAYPRTNRIGEEIKKLVSHLIRNELKDPRISNLTSVVEVDVTRDLRYANIYISVYGTKEEQENTIDGLTKAAGFVRKEIGKNLKLRYTPEPIFKMDTSIEKGLYISRLINKVNEKTPEEVKDDTVK